MSSNAFEAIKLERMLTKENITQALGKVEANKGSSGVDGMRTDELRGYRFEHRGKSAVRSGRGHTDRLQSSWFTYLRTTVRNAPWRYPL